MKRLAIRVALSCLTTVHAAEGMWEPKQLPDIARELKTAGLEIDPATRRNLELTQTLAGARAGSVLAVIDRTVTGAGARLLAERLTAPLTAVGAIVGRLDLVSAFLEAPALREDVRDCLRECPDMARALSRLGLGRGGPRDLAALRAGFPQARLVSIVKEPLEPLLVGSGLVDEILLHRGARDFFAALGRVRAADLDMVVCLSQSPRARLLGYGSGAARRVGLAGGPLQSLLTETVESSGLPSTANDLRLTTALGCPTPNES